MSTVTVHAALRVARTTRLERGMLRAAAAVTSAVERRTQRRACGEAQERFAVVDAARRDLAAFVHSAVLPR